MSNFYNKPAVLLHWREGSPKDINDLYLLHKDNFGVVFENMVTESIAKMKPKAFIQPLSQKFDGILEHIKTMSGNKLLGIPTGYQRFDRFTRGLKGIVILGAPPKTGKSMFAETIAANAAEQGYPVVYIDFENGVNKVCMRLLNYLSGLSALEMYACPQRLSDSHNFEQIRNRFLVIGNNLFVHRPSLKDVENGKSSQSLEAFNNLFERYVSFVREEIGNQREILFVIDSLQKLPLWSMADRRGSIDSWLRAFEWARDKFNVTFIIISELTRGTYDSPTLEAFKESGDIEYSADLAIHMKKTKDESNRNILELHAVAYRDGDIGLIGTYKPDYERCRFEELLSDVIRGEFSNG